MRGSAIANRLLHACRSPILMINEDWSARKASARPPEDLRRYQAETTEKAGCLSGLVRSARMPVSPEEI
jgi:hypothetical protein